MTAHPDAVRVGAPPLVGRLVDELIARGSTGLTTPACVGCGVAGRPLTWTDAGGMCEPCAHRHHTQPCTRCGMDKPVAGRTGDGAPICERCRRHTRGRRRCGICGQTASIAVRSVEGSPQVCANCYRRPEAVCSPLPAATPVLVRRHRHPDLRRPARRGRPRGLRALRPVAAAVRALARRAGLRPLLHRRPATAGTVHRLRHHPQADRPARPGRHGCARTAPTSPTRWPLTSAATAAARTSSTNPPAAPAAPCADGQPSPWPAATGQMPTATPPVFDAIVAARNPRTALNWLRDGAGAAVLAEVVSRAARGQPRRPGRPPAPPGRGLPAARPRRRRVLPDRDEPLARLQQWVSDLLAGIDDPADRRLIQAYATWRVLHQLRRRATARPRPRTPTRHARVRLTAAVELPGLAALPRHHPGRGRPERRRPLAHHRRSGRARRAGLPDLGRRPPPRPPADRARPAAAATGPPPAPTSAGPCWPGCCTTTPST